MNYSNEVKKNGAAEAIAKMTQLAAPAKAAAMQRFFKTGKGQYAEGDATMRKALLELYLAAAPTQINNWDLVDISAPGIVGECEREQHAGLIEHFSDSAVLWEQRIAVVSTLTLIRHDEFDLTLKLCKKFLTHKHDLMHKACGWMLREVGKRDRALLTAFLNEYRPTMPRTMLRYAIEHYPEAQRKAFLAK